MSERPKLRNVFDVYGRTPNSLEMPYDVSEVDAYIAELEAENQRLDEKYMLLKGAHDALEARLTEAERLLREFPHLAGDDYRTWRFGVSAFLNQKEATHE